MESDRPHVVHVIDELPPDGAERLIVDVLSNRSERFRYSVVCLVAGGVMVAELNGMNVPVAILDRRRGFDVGTIPVLMRWLYRNDVAVVHTHLYAADSYGRVAAWLLGIKGRFSTRHNTSAWKGTMRQMLARTIALTSTKLIACGAEIGVRMVEQERIPGRLVTVIPNGIDLRRLERARREALRNELRIAPCTVLLGVVGRLHPQKGHLVLIEALAALKMRTDRFVCVIAGSGELHEEIAASIRQQGLVDTVSMLGQRNDIPDVLAALDVFVMPSLWEGLPMALLEAMALAKPAVASAVGAIPDAIETGVNGVLVPAGDANALAQALREIVNDDAKRRMLGANARNTVVKKFNAADTASAYEALYAAALGMPVESR